MRKVTIIPALATSVLLLTSCGEQEASFEGAVMGEPAAVESSEDSSEEPSEDPSDEPTDESSEESSEDPSEDASEEPSQDPNQDPSAEPGVEDPGADTNLSLPDVPAATGKTVKRKGYQFRAPKNWAVRGKDSTSYDVEPKDYTGESIHVFLITNSPYSGARDMAETQTGDDETSYGFVKFGGQEWSFSSTLSDPATGRRMYYVETAHKKTAYFLTFWGHSDDPNAALERISSVMATWMFR